MSEQAAKGKVDLHAEIKAAMARSADLDRLIAELDALMEADADAMEAEDEDGTEVVGMGQVRHGRVGVWKCWGMVKRVCLDPIPRLGWEGSEAAQ